MQARIDLETEVAGVARAWSFPAKPQPKALPPSCKTRRRERVEGVSFTITFTNGKGGKIQAVVQITDVTRQFQSFGCNQVTGFVQRLYMVIDRCNRIERE
jgi:transposase